MAIIDPVDKFKLTLELITKIPEFDGNNKNLLYFLDRVDSLMSTIESFEDSAKNLLLGYIKDKVVGKAKCQLQRHGRQNNWSEIKTILKNNFGERLSVEKLLDSIRTTRVSTNIEDYYHRINNLLSRINGVYFLENNNSDISAIIESNNRIALQAFKNNLPEPTKSIILSRNPKSLTDAFKIIVEINHQRLGSNTHFGEIGRPQYNSNQNYRSYGQNRQVNNFTDRGSSSHNNSFSDSRASRQYNNNNQGGQSRPYNNYNNRGQSRQNNSSNYSGQSRQSYNNHNNNIYQSRQNNSHTTSGQSRNSNRNRQPNSTESMDITLNEDMQNNNDHSDNRQNFSGGQRNNYPI